MKPTILQTAVCAAVSFASAVFADAHRFTATVNYAGAPAWDVPAALRISETLVDGFDYAAAGDGTHFTITDGTGAVLPYEIDTWNPGGESLLWVKIPHFVNGRKLTVTYGDTERNMASRAAAVWSNYVGVWHMNATNALGKVPNSAGDARFDAVVSSFSRIGEAGRFGQSVLVYTNAWHGGKNDKERGGVFVPDGGDLDLSGDFTVSGWFYHTTVDNPSNDSCAFRWDNLFCKRKHPETKNSANAGDTSGFGCRIGANAETAGAMEAYASSADSNDAKLSVWPVMNNASWHHISFSYAAGKVALRLDGALKVPGGVTNNVGVVTDNDLPFAIGNNGTAYLDEPGGKAWGGRADEVRILASPSSDYLAAEYAAMALTNALVIDSDVCTLEIDRNENFDDAVTVSSDVPAVAEGKYRRGTTVTLTAVQNATGTFRKWYGDVPRESWTNETVSFVIERDSWVYARFVHPWTISSDGTSMTNGHPTTMTDGHFTVNVSVRNKAAHTLTVGKAAEAGLAATNDTGTGTIDLGGPIRLAGDETPWTIGGFGGKRGSQSFPASRAGSFRYLSPGTVSNTSMIQLFHRGDTGENAPPFFGAPYSLIVLDEPAGSALIGNWLFASQSEVATLIVQTPNVTTLNGDRVLNSPSFASTRFDWWDLPSVSKIQHGFFQKDWGSDGSLRRRIPAKGALSLPSMRGLDWLAELSDYGGGTQLFLMPNVEEISLGGKDEETTVTNLCTYAFAGDSSLRKLTLHAAPDIQVGKRIFADHTHNTFRTNEVIDGVSYSIGSQVLRGRVPDVIHFTGPAISETAIANLLDASPVAGGATKPVAIHASRFQPGWGRFDRADWISDPTPAERAAYRGQLLIGVYRAGAEAPGGKAVIVHEQNDWDDAIEPTILLLR